MPARLSKILLGLACRLFVTILFIVVAANILREPPSLGIRFLSTVGGLLFAAAFGWPAVDALRTGQFRQFRSRAHGLVRQKSRPILYWVLVAAHTFLSLFLIAATFRLLPWQHSKPVQASRYEDVRTNDATQRRDDIEADRSGVSAPN